MSHPAVLRNLFFFVSGMSRMKICFRHSRSQTLGCPKSPPQPPSSCSAKRLAYPVFSLCWWAPLGLVFASPGPSALCPVLPLLQNVLPDGAVKLPVLYRTGRREHSTVPSFSSPPNVDSVFHNAPPVLPRQYDKEQLPHRKNAVIEFSILHRCFPGHGSSC